MKKKWTLSENYHTQEIILEDEYVLYKNWFDPGKDPSKEKLSFEDILNGKHDYFFIMELEPWILKELKTAIKRLNKKK